MTAYNTEGTELSDQKDIVDQVSKAIKGASTANRVDVTNPYKSDIIIQFPSGGTMAMPMSSTVTTIAPRQEDLGKTFALMYVHSIMEPAVPL